MLDPLRSGDEQSIRCRSIELIVNDFVGFQRARDAFVPQVLRSSPKTLNSLSSRSTCRMVSSKWLSNMSASDASVAALAILGNVSVKCFSRW
jgi:hypothetical protein